MTQPISSITPSVSGAYSPPPTPSTPPAPSRTARHVLRTIVQVVVAEAAAIPSLASAFHLSAGTTAKISGGVGMIVVLITALQNAGEDAGLIPTLLANPVVKWVQGQVATGQPVVITPATVTPVPVDPAPVPDPVPGDVTDAPTADSGSEDEDPPAVQEGTPSVGNEVSVRRPAKKTAARKTAAKKSTANSRRTRT